MRGINKEFRRRCNHNLALRMRNKVAPAAYVIRTGSLCHRIGNLTSVVV